MKWIAMVFVVPVIALVAFMVLYSIDAGCFICLYGDASGGITEKAVNLVVAATLFFVAFFILKRFWIRKPPS